LSLVIRDSCDVLLSGMVLAYDPFQLAAPCWKVRVLPSLPPEYRRISIEELTNMSLRPVPVAEAPARLKGNLMSSNVDFNIVLGAIRNPENKGKALIVTLEDVMWTSQKNGTPAYPKPEVAFANLLRRYFEREKLAITAYQSGKMEVTVRPMNQTEIAHAKSKKVVIAA
jgi:hypothetical protein